MKPNEPIIEDGVIAGNIYDKYKTTNPVARYLMTGFLRSVDEMVSDSGASDIHEIGCGEGYLSIMLSEKHKARVRASDFSQQVIDKAKAAAVNAEADIAFKVSSIYDMNPENDFAELVVCCEVLEHLEDPLQALVLLSKIAKPYLLISVPREPVWRLLNIMRGKYITSFGNTPGHIQHWSKRDFIHLLHQHFRVLKVRTPLPWIIALCRAK